MKMLQEGNTKILLKKNPQKNKKNDLQCAYEISHGEFDVLTRCLNSADRLPLLDSSMFITLVFVPRMLNLRDLEIEKTRQCRIHIHAGTSINKLYNVYN